MKNVLSVPKVNILGVNITRMNRDQTVTAIKHAIENNRKLFVVVPNVFVVTECRRDDEYRKIINAADLAFADGVPLVWAYVGTVSGLSVGMPGTWEYDDSNSLHARHIVADTGWKILLASKNELTGNKRREDRGSAYLLCVNGGKRNSWG